MPEIFEKKQSEPEPASTQQSSEARDPLEHLSPKITEGGEVETLLTWIAPFRPFRKKNRSYYTTLAIIVILLMLISFLAREFLLIGVLLAITFVTYVLAFIPPTDVAYRLSTQGITIGDRFYFWHSMDSFWIKEKDGTKVIYIQTLMHFPSQLMLVLDDKLEEEAKKIIARFLPFHEIPKTTILDRWAESLQKHFPLENTHR